MANQPKINDAKYIALYYGGEYGDEEECILGKSIENLAEFHYLEEQFKYIFHIFKLEPINRDEYNIAVSNYKIYSSKEQKVARKKLLLKELNEIDKELQNM